MDKIKLLNSIHERRNNWYKIHVEAKLEAIRAEATVKILEEIEQEIQDMKEEHTGIYDILKSMNVYCELFNGNCKNCYFYLNNKQCMMKLINKKVEEKADNGSSANE